MEERRFDDLTRSLGWGASRRTVLKGLAVGLLGGLLGRGTAEVDAAGSTCSTARLQQCYASAKRKRDAAAAGLCGAQQGERSRGNVGKAVDAICTLEVDRVYFKALATCDRAQCSHGGTCVNDHCCDGEHCCDPGIQCGGTSAFEPPTFCCPAGNSCCNDQCCGADNTCCQHTDVGLPFGLRKPSFSYTYSDLTDDPKNCGACDNVCRGEQVCQGGACTCPSGTSTCEGPFNLLCCQPNEYCQASAFGGVQCVPKCAPCEEYDPTDTVQPCKPLECDICQECDPQSSQCMPLENGTSCGSDLFCCSGQCMSETCQGAQTFNENTCQCECPQVSCPGGGLPDPTTCQYGCSSTPPDDCQPPNIWHPEACHCEIDCGGPCGG